ncbi:BAR/IMD domain-containing adapter protein 2-like 2 isoform X2 [Gasterosteus aculeatus]
MSGVNADNLHRSTLRIYSSLMDEFNPSLQKLVSLGDRYMHAFKAFAATSEAYFSALSNIGENALRTVSSRPLGDVLIQISETQRRLTLELDGMFRWFSTEVLQEMDTNIRIDKDYISGSRKHYEMEVNNQAAALDRQLRRREKQDYSDYMQFLRESNSEAQKEEERRYRFLSEKHCSLIQSVARLMNKTGGALQQTTDAWAKQVEATRGHEATRPSWRGAGVSRGMKEEEMRRSREELSLGNVPSRAPSPQGSISRPTGGRFSRARVAHQPAGSNPTLLPFARGELISVLVQQPKNGWLYGRVDGSSRDGWFPAAYVEALDDPPETFSSRSSLQSSSIMGDVPDRPRSSSSQSGAPPPPAPPPLSSYKQYETRAVTPTPDKKAETNSDKKRSEPHGSQPELFPRGTNPFATVKLKPTSTDDRSSPRLYRR